MLNSTTPDTRGKKAAIARSRLLTDFKWTPVCDIKTYHKDLGNIRLLAGEELVGMPYSSCEPNDKFLCENVSFETFLSEIPNPDSAIYKLDLNGRRNSWIYNGIVCNGLVRYAFGIKRRYSTKRWYDISGMRRILGKGEHP